MGTNGLKSLCAVAAAALLGLGATPSREAQLLAAARKGDEASVRALLTQKVMPSAAEPDGTTPLHWAVHHNQLDLVGLLIRAGARPDAENRYGVRPLELAAINGNASIIEVLLRAGASANVASAEGETPLMIAARTGNVDGVALLLNHGAAVNTKETWRGQSALMWAVGERHPAIVRLLLDAGADLHAKSTRGYTPFLFAVRNGDTELVTRLLDAGANVNEKGGEGTTALGFAITNAHFELASFLLSKGADANADMPGGTALHQVTRTRNYEFGAINRPAAVQTGNMDALDLVRVLIKGGADPNARVVQRLARQGSFDNNYLNLTGATSFFLAARAADPVLMRLLLEYGADPNISSTEEVTPLMVAAGAGYVQGQSIGEPANRLEAVRICLELGANVHAVSKSLETAMHGAATGGVNDVVQLLFDRGARLDVKAKDGFTPLQIADGTKSNFRRWDHTADLLRQLEKKTAQQQQQ